MLSFELKVHKIPKLFFCLINQDRRKLLGVLSNFNSSSWTIKLSVFSWKRTIIEKYLIMSCHVCDYLYSQTHLDTSYPTEQANQDTLLSLIKLVCFKKRLNKTLSFKELTGVRASQKLRNFVTYEYYYITVGPRFSDILGGKVYHVTKSGCH